MNKREIEYMISLVDDKYIDELFERQVCERRKNPAIWFGTAAAVLVAAAGIGGAMSMKDSENTVGLQSIVFETPFTEYSSVMTDEEIYTEHSFDSLNDESYTDYSRYFKCDRAALREMIDFTLDAGGKAYDLNGNYVRIGDYSTSDITVYCDESDNAVNTFMRIVNDSDDDEFPQSVNLIINYEGNYSPVLIAERGSPVQWNGVDIYGFDLSNTITSRKQLQAFFCLMVLLTAWSFTTWITAKLWN